MYCKSFPHLVAGVMTICSLGPSAHAGDDGSRPLETVVVVAHPLSAEGLALASDVLEGEELDRKRQASIGATVGYEPGVRSSSFGQAVSRPVIHGLSGARVRVLEDRIDSLDVSVSSADHAVTVEPFLAERIEILKGPSTLIYGSGAIGGVVDVHTGRIPHAAPDRPVTGRAEVRTNDNGNQDTAAARLDGTLNSERTLLWHLDGFSRDANDYKIPGFADSKRIRALTDEGDGEAVRGKVPGSQLRARGGAAGLSWTGERGFAGAAVSLLDSRYGLPGSFPAEPGGEAEAGNPKLDLKQTRTDLETGLEDPFTGATSLNLRVGINNYRHREIEPSGEIATRFDNNAWEARLELVHDPIAGWEGALGLQYSDRDFSAVGEEAFIAPVTTRSAGLFWVAEKNLERFDLEGGLRVERVDINPSDQRGQEFTGLAASLGLVLPLFEVWSLGLLTDFSRRAPVAEELYSDGPHLATRSFEIGNPDLNEEDAYNLAATLTYENDRWFFAATAYYTDFSDFIYQAFTGSLADGLPVLVYAQQGATFKGLDLEVHTRLARWDAGELTVRFLFDAVSAELDTSGNDKLPRIPANRYGLGLDLSWQALRASVDYFRVSGQNDVADFELPTDGYEDLRVYLATDFRLGTSDLTLFVQGNNLTDDEQRNHTSFLKDFVPLPGRTIEGGVQLRF